MTESSRLEVRVDRRRLRPALFIWLVRDCRVPGTGRTGLGTSALYLVSLVLLVAVSLSCSRAPKELPREGDPGKAVRPGAADADHLFDELSKGMQGVTSFRARVTSVGSQVGTSEMVLEAVMPDRFRTIGGQVEMVGIGRTGYIKMPNGEWMKQDLPQNANAVDLKALEEQIKQSSDVKALQDEVIDGIATHVYQANLRFPKTPNAPQGMPETYEAKIWLAASDGRPKRMESTIPGSDVRMTVMYYDYNSAITIDPPIR